MKRLWGRASLWEGVLASLIAAAVLAATAHALAQGIIDPSATWFIPVLAASIAAVIAALAVVHQRRGSVPFVSYMSKNDLRDRIAAARSEMWSFQISGGEFTQTADKEYELWLQADEARQLKVMFANPDNEGLLMSIVKLSGMAERSAATSALPYLRDTIRTSLRRYCELSERRPGQVELKVYDGSPPCSVHAVDVVRGAASGSIFVENYLPRTGWEDRPCFMLRRRHRLFELYARQCLAWFNEADLYPGVHRQLRRDDALPERG